MIDKIIIFQLVEGAFVVFLPFYSNFFVLINKDQQLNINFLLLKAFSFHKPLIFHLPFFIQKSLQSQKFIVYFIKYLKRNSDQMDKAKRLQKITQLALKFKQKSKSVGQFVKIVEVGPRDGLQNEKKIIDLKTKQQLINRLTESGLKSVELGSFVSPKWVPQMASSKQLFIAINKKQGVSYPCLVPNIKGMETALQVGVKQIAVFASATQSFSQKNLNCSIKESLERFIPVVEIAKKNNIKVRGYVSMVMGCPYEGQVQPSKVSDVTKKLFDLGCYEVSLGDTVGKGTPEKTVKLLQELKRFPSNRLAVHFHDTFDNAIENILTATTFGIRVVDSSIGGLGGCPYSMKPVGNVCTQNVAYALQQAGFSTGIDLQKLKQTGEWICKQLQRPNLSIL